MFAAQKTGSPTHLISHTYDATVRCVIMTSPVIDPLGRYRYAKDIEAKGKPYPLAVDELIPCHDAYWKTEAAMDEHMQTSHMARLGAALSTAKIEAIRIDAYQGHYLKNIMGGAPPPAD